MELIHEFSVSVPVEQAWEVLTDVRRIAPCMPGAELTEVDGETYHGLVKVKVGPISAQYKGTASFAEKDEVARRVVLKANGRDARGQGNASATVTAVMSGNGNATVVSIVTDLSVSGRVAQFGRGVMGDVSAKLLEQFVQNLEAGVLSAPGHRAGDGAPAADGAGAAPAPAGQAGAGGQAGSSGQAGAGARGGASGQAGPGAARTDAVRPLGLVMRSIMTRVGRAIARFFGRLTGRG